MTKLEFYGDSWIEHVVYNQETLEMLVYVKGSSNVYSCQNVPLEVYEAFDRAPSRGQYFNKYVKGKYNHEWFE